MQVKIGNEQIRVVNETKFLGVTIDKQLQWYVQVNNVAASLGRKLSQLKRLRAMPSSVLEKIYLQGILPTDLYGIAISRTGPSLAPLKKLIYKLPKDTPNEEVLEKVKWKQIAYLYKRIIALLIHKVINDKVPAALRNLVENSSFPRTRKKLNVKLTIPKSNIDRNTFEHKAALIWNSLPTLAKSKETYGSFKRELGTNSRIIENINFEQTATISNFNSDFIFY